MTVKNLHTRFRAYQLGTTGSSFSYVADGKFTLIEARMTEINKPNILEELDILGKEHIDELHITSWDKDHCNFNELVEILELLKPSKIESPGYEPHRDNTNALNCRDEILEYEKTKLTGGNGKAIKVVSVTPEYISSLDSAKELRYQNSFCWPKYIDDSTSNDNSTVQIFKEGAFNVASLGDIESEHIASYLRRIAVFDREVDIIILAHHGSDHATNSKKFFERTRPTVVVCSSNYDNEYEHPKPVVRQRLSGLNIPIYTTKTGDIIIESAENNPAYFSVNNLCANSSKSLSNTRYPIKKHRLLSMNPDTFRDIFTPRPAYRNIKR